MRHKVARPLQRVVAIASLSVCFAVVGVVVLGHNCSSTWILQVSGKPLIQAYRTPEVAVKTRVATKSRQTSEQAAFSTSGLKKRKCYGAVRNIAAKRERAWHGKSCHRYPEGGVSEYSCCCAQAQIFGLLSCLVSKKGTPPFQNQRKALN